MQQEATSGKSRLCTHFVHLSPVLRKDKADYIKDTYTIKIEDGIE